MRERLRVLAELIGLLRRERNWWLMPIVIGLALTALLVTISVIIPLSPLLYPLI